MSINDELLQRGIDLVTKGDLGQASIILAQVVKADPKSEQGWLWLGRSRVAPNEKRYCFKMALSINPSSKDAQYELSGLDTPVKPVATAASIPAEPPPAIAAVAPVTDKIEHRPKKNWVRRGIYLLAGIMVGIYLGWYLAGILANMGFFDRIDNAIALRSITVPEFNTTQEIPRLIEPTPTVSLTESYDERLERAWPVITQANNLTLAQRYADAVPIWNQALAIVPEYVDGYYKRGASYFYLTRSQRAKSEYDAYLQLAIADFDTAIQLDPKVGDYYIMRGRVYDSLASQQSLRADFLTLQQVALENFLQAEKLPLSEDWNNKEINILNTMVQAGMCEDVIPKIVELLNSESTPSPGLHQVLSDAYYCVGDLEKALEQKNETIKLAPSAVCLCERALILYGLGRFDEAMDDIEKSLSSQPYYGGHRYYFRALLYADRGDLEQAQKDLDFGITQTWVRGGMLAYVQGKIALGQDRTEDAIVLFRDAEATFLNQGPMLDQIRHDLLALGGTPFTTQDTLLRTMPTPLFPTMTPTVVATPSLTVTP